MHDRKIGSTFSGGRAMEPIQRKMVNMADGGILRVSANAVCCLKAMQ
jgi:hypothetical protein